MSKTRLEQLDEMISVADAITSTTTNDTTLWHTWRERSETLRDVAKQLVEYQQLLNDLEEYIPDWEEQLERTV